MKLLLTVLVSMMASSAMADYVVEGKIQFAGHKWVKASNVCVAGDNFYHKNAQPRVSCPDEADGSKADISSGRCTVFAPVKMQPMVSTAARCARFEGEAQGGACLKWITVDFIQTAKVKNVHYSTYSDYDQGGSATGVSYTVVPECSFSKEIEAN